MPLLRIRTEIDDRPGRLARLTAALAAGGANILDLTVQVGTDGVVDEFVVDVPPRATGDRHSARHGDRHGDEHGDRLRAAVEAAGGTRTAVVPARPRELMDEPTRALTLVARLRSDPRALPEALAELLRADSARWVYGPAAEQEPPDALTVPAGRLRSVRLWRAGLPFTVTESARANALVRAALPQAEPDRASRRVSLRDGTQIIVRPLEGRDGTAVRAMHQRCSAESRRLRYFSAKPLISQRMLNAFAASSHGVTLVAEGPDGSILALAHLMHVLEPGVAELAFLVEDHWQGRGLGRVLAGLLLAMGRERGLVELRAPVLSENGRMRELLTSFGGRVGCTDHPGVVEIKLRLDGQPERRGSGERAGGEAGRGR